MSIECQFDQLVGTSQTKFLIRDN